MDTPKPPVGAVAWTDLTVSDASRIKEFYCQVVGWEAANVEMGGYTDYSMVPPGAQAPVAGVCHARGSNTDLPPVWLVYLIVRDVVVSAERCRTLGGEVLVEPRGMGGGNFCVIRDPAGAVCALYQP